MQESSPKLTAYLSLGSDVDDRLDYLNTAKEKLKNHPDINIIAESKVYETEPWPHTIKKDKYPDDEKGPGSEMGPEWFLNQVIKIQTSLSPDDLLEEVEKIEKDLGRTK
jgi:2-amino-4-hydroxy-6-hydroxymethyldihydropteridine diphosphokinase